MARITIPTDPAEIIVLAKAIHAKHIALADKSPLAAVECDKIAPTIADAGTFDNNADFTIPSKLRGA